MINRNEYPELNQLLWDYHAEFIDPKVAFGVYERRWSYVDNRNISNKEKKLIEKLSKELGNGIFMPNT